MLVVEEEWERVVRGGGGIPVLKLVCGLLFMIGPLID